MSMAMLKAFGTESQRPSPPTRPVSSNFVQAVRELEELHLHEVRRLEESNVALRRELAEMQSKATPLDSSGRIQVLDPGLARKEEPDRLAVQTPTKLSDTAANEVWERHSLAVLSEDRQGRPEKVQGDEELMIAPITGTDSFKKVTAQMRRASTVFKEIFDIQAAPVESHRKAMSLMEQFFRSDAFDLTIGVVICLNAICIGIEAAWQGSDTPVFLLVLEYVFLAIYVLELAIAFNYVGWLALRNNWVQFDILLVACGLAAAIHRAIGRGDGLLNAVVVVRMLRLARVARILRVMRMFKTLWRLVHGLIHASATLIWTLALLFVLLFTFAVFGMELIQEDSSMSETYNRIARENFNNLWSTCVTLVQVVTLDSVGPIYRPLLLEHPALAFYFYLFILLVSIALMNLVTAIMVESALDKSAADKEVMRMWELENKKKKVDRVQEIFIEMDADGSGKLTLQELLESPEELRREFAELVETEDFGLLFEVLDIDGTGAVGIKEFCDGIDKICRGKLELFSVMFQGNAIMKKSQEILTVLHELKALCIAQGWPAGVEVLSSV